AEPTMTAEALATLWAELARDMPADAMARLVQAPVQAVTLLGNKLRPAAVPRAGRVAELLAFLGSPRVPDRAEAMQQLQGLAELIEPDLREHLKGQPVAEARRR